MDDSKFNLWRACFAFCQIDSLLADQEEDWIHDKLTKLDFTQAQIKLLLSDMDNPPDLKKILPLITKPADRGFLIDQMRVLANIDGKLSPEEKQKISEIRSIVLSHVKLNDLESQIAADEMASYHEDEVFKVDNKNSFFERLHRFGQKILNPGTHKLPGEGHND